MNIISLDSLLVTMYCKCHWEFGLLVHIDLCVQIKPYKFSSCNYVMSYPLIHVSILKYCCERKHYRQICWRLQAQLAPSCTFQTTLNVKSCVTTHKGHGLLPLPSQSTQQNSCDQSSHLTWKLKNLTNIYIGQQSLVIYGTQWPHVKLPEMYAYSTIIIFGCSII